MQLIDIAIREKSRAPMQTLTNAMLTKATGVYGDFRGKPNNRQVTLLSQSQWQAACHELGTQLPWTTRRANLLVNGIEFDAGMVKKALKIGDAVLLITGETDPCLRMDQAHMGLKQALTPNWRGGVTCRVIADGKITTGDKLNWL